MKKKKNILLLILKFLSIIISFISLTSFLIYGIKLLIKGNVKYGCIVIICAIVFIAIDVFLIFFDNAEKKRNKTKRKIFNFIFKYFVAILKTVVIVLSMTESAKHNVIEATDLAWLIWIQLTIVADIILRVIILIVKLIIFAIRKIRKKNKKEEESFE